MMPPADALQYPAQGRPAQPDRAKTMKLIDAVVPRRRSDRDGEGLDQGRRQSRSSRGTRTASSCPAGRSIRRPGMMTLPGRERDLSPRDLRQLSGGARASCRSCSKACRCRSITALRIESRYFAKIVRSPEAAAMIRSLFVSMQELNKGARRPAGVPADQARRRSASSAPASWAPASRTSRAQAGIDVVLIDRDQADAPTRARPHSHKR